MAQPPLHPVPYDRRSDPFTHHEADPYRCRLGTATVHDQRPGRCPAPTAGRRDLTARTEPVFRGEHRDQAASFDRPLRRRDETISRPARVRIRRRNPCLRARRRLFGWNVRLLTGVLPIIDISRLDGHRPPTSHAMQSPHSSGAIPRANMGMRQLSKTIRLLNGTGWLAHRSNHLVDGYYPAAPGRSSGRAECAIMNSDRPVDKFLLPHQTAVSVAPVQRFPQRV